MPGICPLWLSPVQVVVATITQEAEDYGREVVAAARAAGLRVEGDFRNEKITYKVREHSLAKVPVLLVLGRKEAAERTVSIRRLGFERPDRHGPGRGPRGAGRRGGAAGPEAQGRGAAGCAADAA